MCRLEETTTARLHTHARTHTHAPRDGYVGLQTRIARASPRDAPYALAKQKTWFLGYSDSRLDTGLRENRYLLAVAISSTGTMMVSVWFLGLHAAARSATLARKTPLATRAARTPPPAYTTTAQHKHPACNTFTTQFQLLDSASCACHCPFSAWPCHACLAPHSHCYMLLLLYIYSIPFLSVSFFNNLSTMDAIHCVPFTHACTALHDSSYPSNSLYLLPHAKSNVCRSCLPLDS